MRFDSWRKGRSGYKRVPGDERRASIDSSTSSESSTSTESDIDNTEKSKIKLLLNMNLEKYYFSTPKEHKRPEYYTDEEWKKFTVKKKADIYRCEYSRYGYNWQKTKSEDDYLANFADNEHKVYEKNKRPDKENIAKLAALDAFRFILETFKHEDDAIEKAKTEFKKAYLNRFNEVIFNTIDINIDQLVKDFLDKDLKDFATTKKEYWENLAKFIDDPYSSAYYKIRKGIRWAGEGVGIFSKNAKKNLTKTIDSNGAAITKKQYWENAAKFDDDIHSKMYYNARSKLRSFGEKHGILTKDAQKKTNPNAYSGVYARLSDKKESGAISKTINSLGLGLSLAAIGGTITFTALTVAGIDTFLGAVTFGTLGGAAPVTIPTALLITYAGGVFASGLTSVAGGLVRKHDRNKAIKDLGILFSGAKDLDDYVLKKPALQRVQKYYENLHKHGHTISKPEKFAFGAAVFSLCTFGALKGAPEIVTLLGKATPLVSSGASMISTGANAFSWLHKQIDHQKLIKEGGGELNIHSHIFKKQEAYKLFIKNRENGVNAVLLSQKVDSWAKLYKKTDKDIESEKKYEKIESQKNKQAKDTLAEFRNVIEFKKDLSFNFDDVQIKWKEKKEELIKSNKAKEYILLNTSKNFKDEKITEYIWLHPDYKMTDKEKKFWDAPEKVPRSKVREEAKKQWLKDHPAAWIKYKYKDSKLFKVIAGSKVTNTVSLVEADIKTKSSSSTKFDILAIGFEGLKSQSKSNSNIMLLATSNDKHSVAARTELPYRKNHSSILTFDEKVVGKFTAALEAEKPTTTQSRKTTVGNFTPSV